MVSGGLIDLVAHGVQDIYLIGNPQITYFKSVYKRHTNFSIESVRASFEGDMDFGNKVVCKIPKTGDLMHTMMLEIDLPQLVATGSDDMHTISYIPNIGHSIIDYCDLRIGGQLIDRQYGEWMQIWTDLTYTENKRDASNQMVGYQPRNGPATLNVPLQFWFCRNIGSALPLCALLYHDVELDIHIRPLNQLYYFGNPAYYDLTYLSSPASGQYIYQRNNGRLFTPDINAKTLVYTTGTATITYDSPDTIILNALLTGSQLTKTYVRPTYTLVGTPQLTEMRLFIDYIYLDTYERKYFATAQHRYLIEQIQQTSLAISGTELLKRVHIGFNLPVKELCWIFQTAENYNHNLLTNFTNTPDEYYSNPSDFIDTMTILYNGNPRFLARAGEYFRLTQPFQHHTNIPYEKYIHCYSTAILPEVHQPSGASNYSKIEIVELYMNMRAGNPDYSIRVYGVNYNVLRIALGMGGVAFSS